LARAVLALFLAFAGLSNAADPKSCAAPPNAPVIVQSEFEQLHKSLVSSPFYRELTRRFGKPLSCRVEANDGNISVTFEFRDHAKLFGEANQKLETSQQRMEVRGVAEKTALALLKTAEKRAYRAAGCGIDWKKSETEKADSGAHEVIFRGAACNCQGRIVYQEKAVVALVLKSAC